MGEQAKHTPGPWKVGRHSDERTLVVGGPDTDGICECYDWNGPHVTGKPNARLIAAAPELLEALKAALPALRRIHSMTPGGPKASDALNRLNLARAAIDKAQPNDDRTDSRASRETHLPRPSLPARLIPLSVRAT